MFTTNLEDKKTKIIATLGPASLNEDTLRELILEGVDVFRFNASHNAEPKQLKKNIKLIRKISKKLDRYVGILLDLQGPKIRVGKIEGDSVELVKGQPFSLSAEECLGSSKKASITYDGLVKDVSKGDLVYIDDGKIQLSVKETSGTQVKCDVIRGGTLSNNKGVNLPLTKMSISPYTKKDQLDVKNCHKLGLDYLALSFVCHEDDIKRIKLELKKLKADHIKIIAKIERQQAIDRLVPIIDEADAIMVARGDLGVEVGVEKVPRLQKLIIRESNKRIKPVIVATQMLESMILQETATRAEVSDVANAVYDNCDAVMLSAETAVGINPGNVVKVMVDICTASEEHKMEIRKDYTFVTKNMFTQDTRQTSLCNAANQVAESNKANAIISFTSSGATPLVVSKAKSSFPIIAPTDVDHVRNQMCLYRGVFPLTMPKPFNRIKTFTDMIKIAVKEAKKKGYLSAGDTVVVTAGIPIGESNGINSIRVVDVK
ncbi:pyruvate kinase [Candidatus Marinamargulisbacteria bacterium SCGC AAA071-K20]|nr:pyruvate kinase [Candidatus Marinamargulisbacteria bacterium SCGC AAA071-K20]